MYPFRRILIPTDFSTASKWAFDDAVRIAARNGAEILILHIRMTWEKAPGALRFPAPASVYEYAEKQELEKLREQVRASGAEIGTRLIVKNAPDPGDEICRTAKEEGADLTVIATHARHHVAHLFVGSTTMSVINKPPAPILAIRYGIRKHEDMKRIIVPVHLKQKSQAAFKLAVEVARDRRSEVHLLSVCDDAMQTETTALLQSVAASASGIDVKTHLVRGNNVEREIIRYADKSGADVIFLNADQQVRKTKADIIRQASTPVMIVPSS